MKIDRRYLLPFSLVSLLFLLWGLANNMNDTLLAAFKRIMSMSDFQTSLVQFAFYGAYFCMALPAALFIRRYSFKKGILLGLALYACGTLLFYPAGEVASYGFFLFSIYIMAAGCAVLETTANPYILSMGSAATATRRLNIAQTLNPVGAIFGILLSRHFILSELHEADAATRENMPEEILKAIQHDELSAVSGTYVLIGITLLILLALMAVIKMPGSRDESSSTPIGATFKKLASLPRYRKGVLAQFFYVGVQTCVWSFTIRFVMAESELSEADASLFFLYSILAFTAFRFIFTWLMGRYAPVRLLAISSCLAIFLTSLVIVCHGPVAIYSLVAISACMSLMFPTIYGIALEGITGDESKIAASGLIMAILGAAVITPLQALVSDICGISISFLIPLVCFIIVTIYSFGIIKEDNAE